MATTPSSRDPSAEGTTNMTRYCDRDDTQATVTP